MDEGKSIEFPHMLTRMYLDESSYSVDFYQYHDDENYIRDFIKGIEQLERGFEKSGNLSLRSTPFYFTKCTKCDFYILTNRDHGFKIDCQICKFKNICKPFHKKQLDSIIHSLHNSKIKIVNRKGQMFFLLIQPSAENKINDISQICQNENFQQQDVNGFAGYQLFTEGLQRGILNYDCPRILFRKKVEENILSNSIGTPRSIEKLLQNIRSIDPKICSFSMDMEIKKNDLISYLMLDMIDDAIKLLNNELENDSSNEKNLIILYGLLLQKGESERANEILSLAQIKYPNDPNILVHVGQKHTLSGNYDKASEIFEDANRLDPINSLAILGLIHCYRTMGKENLALEFEAKLRSIGGII